jgi:hypothetical protein
LAEHGRLALADGVFSGRTDQSRFGDFNVKAGK